MVYIRLKPDLDALLCVEEGDAAQRLVELGDQRAVLQVRRLRQLKVDPFYYYCYIFWLRDFVTTWG